VCISDAVYTTGKYKKLENLVNKKELPVLVEQKRASRLACDAHQVDVLGTLMLTEEFVQTFLVVNCINDGMPSLFDISGIGTGGNFDTRKESSLIKAKQNIMADVIFVSAVCL